MYHNNAYEVFFIIDLKMKVDWESILKKSASLSEQKKRNASLSALSN